MTKITTTMENRVECDSGILYDTVRYIERNESLTKDFADVLHWLNSGDGHRLLTLGDCNCNGKLRHELPDREVFYSQLEVKVVA